MDPEQRAAVERLFDELADAPASEQRARLDAVGAHDEALAREVGELLRAAARPHQAVGLDPASFASFAVASSPPLVLPHTFGRYRVRKFLNDGGMGAVYEAERTDVGGIVALKFLHPWSSPASQRSFAREQRTLARLSHPHIAQLYDAGTTKDGAWLDRESAWFAMEFVPGALSITAYCTHKALGLNDRLRLFNDACEAVAYAHGQLVLHLDLKPSNILVDADGQVKLVDFGVARSLSHVDGTTNATDNFLTLNSASPEQLRGQPLNVQADVYGLAVVLYELLTGVSPHDGRNGNHVDIARRLENVPRRTSVVSREGHAPPVRASRAAWRELDAICMTALHPDPAERYKSADLLMRDVQHFLANEPLDGAPTGLRAYRFRKFVRRHQWPIASIGAALILIAALTTFFTVRLIEALDRAVASEARTQQVNDLMMNLFAGDDSEAGPAASLRVVDLLERGARAADDLDRTPELQANLRHTLGGLFHQLGYPDRAEALLLSAWHARRTSLGRDDRRTIQALSTLTMVRIDQDRLDDAERDLHEGLDAVRSRDPIDRVEMATLEAVRGKLLAARGAYGEAIVVLNAAVGVLAAQQPTVSLSEALGDLVNTYYYLGDIDAAEAQNNRAREVDRVLFSERHPHYGVDVFNFGNIRLDRGDYSAAADLFRQAHEIYRDWYGLNHPKTGSTFLMLGRTMTYEGRWTEAAAFYEQADAVMRRTYPEHHFRIGIVLTLKGDLAREQGDLDDAEQLFRNAAAIFRKSPGEKHEFYLHQLSNLAAVSLLRRNFREAETLARAALGGLQQVVPNQRYTAMANVRLAEALAGQRRYSEAESHALAGYEILQRTTGPEAAEQRAARRTLEIIYEGLGESGKAREFQTAVARQLP